MSSRTTRTYVKNPREPRCSPKCAQARRPAQHSTRCTGKRGNAAGAHFGRNPFGDRTIKEALIYARGRAGVFAHAGQGARSAIGLLPMSEEQRSSGGRKGPAPLGFRPQGRICGVARLGHRPRYGAAPGRLASTPLWTETRFAEIDQSLLRAHGFVAPRSCSPGYTALTASRPGPKSPKVAAARVLEIGSGLLLIAALSAANVCSALESDRDEPITIESDRAELDQVAQVGTYTGNVVVSQGSFQLNADTMVVTVEDGALSHIVAKGDPTDFKQRPEGHTEDVKGGAKQIDFFADRSLIVLSGDAWVRQGEDMVQSPRIEYEVETDRVRAVGTGDEGGRVRMIFHPGARDE